MNEKTTIIGALALIAALALGIYFYNRNSDDQLENGAPGSTINVESNDAQDDLNATSSPYYNNSFEPTAS